MASASGNSILCDQDGAAIIDGYSWLNKPFTEEIKSVFGDGFGSEVFGVAVDVTYEAYSGAVGAAMHAFNKNCK